MIKVQKFRDYMILANFFLTHSFMNRFDKTLLTILHLDLLSQWTTFHYRLILFSGQTWDSFQMEHPTNIFKGGCKIFEYYLTYKSSKKLNASSIKIGSKKVGFPSTHIHICQKSYSIMYEQRLYSVHIQKPGYILLFVQFCMSGTVIV